jgi:hypothetical protein
MLRIRISAVLVLLPALLLAKMALAESSQNPVVSIAVENISLASVTTDRVQFTANVSLSGLRKVTLHEVVFDQLNANGIPFYASPMQDRLVLVPNQKVLPPKPLLLTVYLRDLVSLKPLRSLIEDGKFSITGTAYASVDLNPAEKLFLFTGRAHVPMKIDSVVELRIPGGPIARATALLLIDHLQGGVESAGSAWQSAARMFSEQREWVWKNYEPALVLAHATYELRNGTGKSVRFESTAMGFRVNGKQVVLPKSVLEPWKFDPYVAASMQQDGSLKVTDYELALWPANSHLRNDAGQLCMDQAWLLSTHQIRLLPLPKDDSEAMFLPVEEGKIVKIRIHRRQGSSALGLVEITDPSVPALSPILAAPSKAGGSNHASSEVKTLAIFRFPGGIEAREAKPGLLLVPQAEGGNGLELDISIDSSGWGSPVISLEGIVGVVTNEHSTLPIAEAAKVLKFDTAQPYRAGER